MPESELVVAEHWDDFDGDVVLHLLVADVRRLCEDAWRRQDYTLMRRYLDLLDWALRTGDEHVSNAVSVSFVEDTGLWDAAMRDYVAAWPPALAAEADRLQQAPPES